MNEQVDGWKVKTTWINYNNWLFLQHYGIVSRNRDDKVVFKLIMDWKFEEFLEFSSNRLILSLHAFIS